MNLLLISELRNAIDVNLTAANRYLEQSDACLKRAAAYRTDATERVNHAIELTEQLEKHVKQC